MDFEHQREQPLRVVARQGLDVCRADADACARRHRREDGAQRSEDDEEAGL